MPMIDITTSQGVLPAEAREALRAGLVEALLGAEGLPLASPYLENTGVFLHELPRDDVADGRGWGAPVVRVLVTTPPGVLDRTRQRSLVADATRLVREAVPGEAPTTWVLLTEAAEGGWGVGGVALGRQEFAALRAAS